jgi:release factor glutamine methyltransferase
MAEGFAMTNWQTVDVGRHRVNLAARETVGPPTPYTQLLAESIPDLPGLTVVDIGTGSGILGIVAGLQGASRVYILDTNPAAVEAALDNANRNGVGERFVSLAIGDSIIPLPPGETVDVVISNPAQLPLPKAAEAHSPYYAGPDGRRMIEEVITATPARLSPGGRLLMVHNSVTDFPKSIALMQSVGLRPRVLSERSLELRPLFDRDWLDELDGAARGLYSLKDGRAYETIYAVEARLE